MRLHFDGYSECHDFWLNADSPDIHPAGWFEETGHQLQPPKGKELMSLSWWVLLKEGDKQWAPKHRAADGDRVAPWGSGGLVRDGQSQPHDLLAALCDLAAFISLPEGL